ncbi:MAG: beta-N-acetylhexosaminidase [Bacteroidales bacterium]|nr:beta-N-acetylhexosaminidase [Bacteroidales bacterium]
MADNQGNGRQGLIPAPVEYSQEKSHTCFKKAVAQLEPWQQKEAYRLTIKGKKIKIEALTEEGRFRANSTLEQLQALGELPQGTIFDYPRLRHRGLMIDESRSFKGLEFLKKQIDAMALLKLNVLHLHLDDSAGWRIEIDSYPNLAAATAFRLGYTYHEWESGKYRFSCADDPSAYGGYYTKDELRELVAYAAERFITVIPEIEMPGHSMEVGYAYPEVLCVHPNGKTHTGAWDLCPGSEATYKLLEAVLTEVMEIFPSPLIHIGGDEATMKTWSQCVNCAALMEKEGYTSVKELQGYLVRRIEAFVKAHGRRIIGWDEILETGVPEDAVVESWRGVSGGEKASALGHDVIMSPNTHCYYNYYQDLIRKEPKAVGELVSLRFTYGYEPLAEGMDPAHLFGVQANLWTELIPTPEHAEYMLYPRLFALAETAWSPSSAKEYKGFRKRARRLLDVFRARGYRTFDMDTESDLARSGLQRFPPEGQPIPVDD